MKKDRLINLCVFTACLLIGVIYLLFFSRTTSPLFKPNGTDSYTLILVGRELLRGGLPYVTLTDNKGPLIWYIEALAQLIIPGKNGVFVMQCAFMAGNLFLLYKISDAVLEKHEIRSKITRVLISCLSIGCFLCSLIIWYEYGNLTEEYSLFFVILSIYIFSRRVLYADYINYIAFVGLGGCLGAIFMIRMNDCLSVFLICMIALFIAHGIKSLRISVIVLYTLVGFLFVCFICSIQYILSGNFKSLLFDYLFVSSEFIKSADGFIETRMALLRDTAFGVLVRRVCMINVTISVASFVNTLMIHGRKINVKKNVWLLLSVVIPICFMISSIVKARGFLHYAMFMAISISIACLNLSILIVENIKVFTFNDKNKNRIKKAPNVILLCALFLCLFYLAHYFLIQYKSTINYYKEAYKNRPEEINYSNMMELSRKIDGNREDVTGLGISPDWYYISETMTKYKYLFPLSLLKKSDTMREKFDLYLTTVSPKWLIVYNSIEAQSAAMYSNELEYINNNYMLVGKNGYGELYRLK